MKDYVTRRALDMEKRKGGKKKKNDDDKKTKACHMERGRAAEETTKWITEETTVAMFHVQNHLSFSV